MMLRRLGLLCLATASGLSVRAPPTASSRVVRMTAESVAPSPPIEPIEVVPPHQTVRVGDEYLAGDMGFDPLLLADTPKKLLWFREAEIKHARLAMLAAVGWPLSELFDGPLAATFGLPSKLLADGRVPAQLNGGLDQINSAYWIAIVAAAVFVESKSLDAMFGKKASDYSPGMLGYDIFGYDSPSMRKAEITNGRVAMVAITVFAFEEAFFQAPVVRETSIFFQPIWTTLGF